MKKKERVLSIAQEKKEEVEKMPTDKLKNAKGDPKKAGQDVHEAAMKEYEKIKNKMDETSEKVKEYIRKNPSKATLISAGIGTALGAIIAMLISKKKK